jgi:hypothetical protein
MKLPDLLPHASVFRLQGNAYLPGDVNKKIKNCETNASGDASIARRKSSPAPEGSGFIDR